MNELQKEVNQLVEQMRYLLLNKEIPESLKIQSKELETLQEAILYLEKCCREVNAFTKELSIGNLDIAPPNRHNYLASYIKALHSSLKHLSWQAGQVANGDYSQQVTFLGDFSLSFNQMIAQLADREMRLKEQSARLSENLLFLQSIMDGLSDCIVVTDAMTNDIIYTNDKTQKWFLYALEQEETKQYMVQFVKHMEQMIQENKAEKKFTSQIQLGYRILKIQTRSMQWYEQSAYVHCITDITEELNYQSQIEAFAYKDEMTGLYNRRYLMDILKDYIMAKDEFIFCLIDLDGLKKVNDTYGHLYGDAYIQTVSKEMTHILSSMTKHIVRMGGDEFAFLVAGLDQEEVLRRLSLIDERMIELSDQYDMSISYGFYVSDKKNQLTMFEIIEYADQEMYELKRQRKKQRQ